MDDEAVSQFAAVTGADPSRAQQYLTLSDGNLERAIQLWYETDGVDMMGASASEPPPPSADAPAVPHHSRPRPDVVNIESDEEAASDVEFVGSNARPAPTTSQAPNHSEEDDEAMARRLQEEMYGGGGDVRGGLDAEGVRAPIARTTETLVGPDAYDLQDPNDRATALAEQIMRRRLAQQARHGPGGGQPAAWGSIWDQSEDFAARAREQAERAGDDQTELSRKTTMLAAMFRPPFDLMSRLDWDSAREEGKANERWLLVNVQDPSIFDCQLLNRDIWKHEGIRETVQEHFIFLQYAKDDPRGGQYMQYYFQNRDTEAAYPHIAIVDPRTGEQVKVWSGPPAPKPMDFLMQLHEFLDRYSLSAAAKNPVARRKPEAPAASRVDAMTEEEQLQMAMQASLAGGSPTNNHEAGPSRAAAAADPDDLTRSVPELKADTADAASGTADVPMSDADALTTPPPEAEPAPSATNSIFAAIPADRAHAEPAAGAANATRIQFRHPEGRVVRRFALSEPVQRLYEWLKAEPLPGTEGKEVALSFMGRNLLGDVEAGMTIEGAGLRNGSVNVEVVDGE